MVTSFACKDSRSLSASWVKSSVIAWPVKRELAITRRSAPSSSRTLERIRFAMKNATSSGRCALTCCAFVMRIATQVSSSGGSIATVESPAEARLQPLLQPCDFLRIAIAAQDDLVLTLEQLVEGMEELFLRAVLAGEELDVIDEQRIQRAVRGLELDHGVVLQRTRPCRRRTAPSARRRCVPPRRAAR